VNLGSLGSGAEAYKNLDEFASKAKPSAGDLPNGEMTETITLTLKAYTDVGYTDLKWTYNRNVTVHWINSLDPAWTLDVSNNFDDGTVQGWAFELEKKGHVSDGQTIGVATDYVLSTPYSLRARYDFYYGPLERRYGFSKNFTTPDRDKVFAIINARASSYQDTVYHTIKYEEVKKDSDVLIHLGKVYDSGEFPVNVPGNKWLRIVVLLPKNTSLALKIIVDINSSGGAGGGISYLWMDDFKIISKS